MTNLLNKISKLGTGRFLIMIVAVGISIGIGWLLGNKEALNTLNQEEVWKSMNPKLKEKAFPHALAHSSWDGVPKDIARNTLAKHLNRSEVPHGDMVVGSYKSEGGPHSGRYVISQWQRVAAGAIVIVLGENEEGKLFIAMGPQRGKIRVPQGYMESNLPNEDLTGLRKRDASRINGSNGELVSSDDSLEDTAVREVWEEIGVRVKKENLKLLDIVSYKDANPIVQTIYPVYGIKILGTPSLRTVDTEFADDGLSNPKWFKVSEIRCSKGKCYGDGSKFPLEHKTIPVIQKAIREFANEDQQKECKTFLNAS
jgi:8-oxo-dGTP pyrophosphatase MutT (NUDIX family)